MDEIFAAAHVKGAIACARLAPENNYCDKPVATVDPQSGIVTGLRTPKHLYLRGGEGDGDVFAYDQRSVNAIDSYFLIDFDDGRAWVRAKTADLRDLEADMAEIVSSNSTKIFALSPRLQKVYLTKDAQQPIPTDGIFALQDDPNERIGTLEIVLDMAETRDPSTAKSSVQFSYPYYGEKSLNSYELLEANTSKRNPNPDPFKIKLPVLRKSSAGYLVQLPARWQFLFLDAGRYKGAIPIWDSSAYAWVASKGISLNWKAGATDALPLFQEEELSPKPELRMDKGPVFQKDGTPWTSLKINALYFDLDNQPPPKPVSYDDDARKQVFLREIFFPLYDAEQRIQLWPEWEPGC